MENIIVVIVTLLLCAGCTSKNVNLPTSGVVYYEDSLKGNLSLVPLENALIFVRRGFSCPPNKLMLGAGGGETIDRYLIRTNNDGVYDIPERKYRVPSQCKTNLRPLVVIPYKRSSVGYVLKDNIYNENIALYQKLNDFDVVVIDKSQTLALDFKSIPEELLSWLKSFNSPGHIPPEYISILRELNSEICSVLSGISKESADYNNLLRKVNYDYGHIGEELVCEPTS